jgi:hypothetical protein
MLQEPNTVQTFDGSNHWVNKNNTTIWLEDFVCGVNASGKMTKQTINV